MSSAQVCVLLVASLMGGLGAPLAQAAPAATAARLRPVTWSDDQSTLGQRLTDAAPADAPADYDYYLYEYDYYDYGDSVAEPAADGAESEPALADGGQSAEVAARRAGPAVSEDTNLESEKQRPSETQSENRVVTARPGVPTMAASSHRATRRKSKIPPTISTVRHKSTKRSNESKQTKTAARLQTTSVLHRSVVAPSTTARPTTLSTSTSTQSVETTATPTESSPSPPKTDVNSASGTTSTESSSSTDEDERVNEERSNHVEPEQEASGSSRVLTFHVQQAQHAQHSRVAKSPRDPPDFFVPPIRRRPSRRRVPALAPNPPASSRSLGAQLAQQVRRQLAQLQTQQADALTETSSQPSSSAAPAVTTSEPYKHPFIPSSPTTTSEPYKHPFIPSSPTTTSEPYKHPFIPSSPTTTSEPYKHPFIPSSPTTTSEPYKHPFIPSSPTTTSEPYKHPFIPSSPTTTSEPYQHPHIPVPPESTRRPAAASTTSAPSSPPLPEEQADQPERPQARRVPAGSDGAVPRLHLPRPPAASTAPAATSTTSLPPTAAAPAAATIVHEQTVEAGFIVGEYGELGGGGTVRGVKYAADSSVDRSLLEAALQQFLRL